MLERVLNKLEFHKVKRELAKHTECSLGFQLVDKLQPESALSLVTRLQQETDEGANVLRLKGHIPFGGVTDIRASLKRSEIGGMLSAKELIDIAGTVRGTRLIKQFILDVIEDKEISLPILAEIILSIQPENELERRIQSCISDQGQVLDTASDTLRSVRTQMRTYNTRIKEKLESIVRSPTYQKMLSEAIVTIRNDRHVVPVKQEYRGTFGGIVHDQSASGATLFIEPQSIFDMTNKLSEAKAKERHEVERILTDLSEQTALVAEVLYDHVERLAHLDFIFAKAKFGNSMKATRPMLNDKGNMMLKKARHPLIPVEQVVPIDVQLGDDYQAIIITGPNTGGKTVTLKTIGLLTLMAQSGLHIPAEEESIVNVFMNVFADIGDEQSIEQNLSTFSSHMTNIIDILSRLDHQSLVLFDELGAGTDPQEGAALSISILDTVYNRGATVIATTHYSELKAYAYERKGVINASVEFDVNTLSPTYRLLMGVPGRSNAFEISRKLGLSEAIIDQAKTHISSETNQVDKMIASLEQNRKEAELAHHEAKRMKMEVDEKRQQLIGELEKLEETKEQMINEAKVKAQVALEHAKKEAQEIINELRQLKGKNENIKDHQLIDAKSRLDHALDSLSADETRGAQSTYKKKERLFEPGQQVKIISFGQKGHIIEKLNHKEYLVQVGIIKMNLPANDLKAVKEEKETKPVVNIRATTTVIKTELDLRGERYEDAMIKLEQYLDAALLAGYSQVSIIHGKGTGVLRKAVQQFLKNHSRIKNARLGGAGEGGNGITVVEFK